MLHINLVYLISSPEQNLNAIIVKAPKYWAKYILGSGFEAPDFPTS